MARLFGTDGVRGLANDTLTAELALDLSVAAAHVLGDVGAFAGHRPTAVVGRDPRASGEFLEAAVVAGLASAGVDVLLVGVAPTPAIAFLTASTDADLGVMLSASHNPMPDNGIKFFSRGGHKLPDEIEDAVEARIGEPWARPTGLLVGRVRDDRQALDTYVDHLVATLPHRLDGLRIVVDGANGAASWASPEALRRAGAEVVTLSCEPDGWNINDGCGSTHLEPLRNAVLSHQADLGIAHDGDADRCLAVAADGSVVDGDHILAILALAMRESGRLAADAVVSTVMANLGFRLAMQEHAIEVVETAVGDRYVLEVLRQQGLSLGGEQSGHVIMLDHATTGDGLLTALHLAAEVARSGRTLAELATVMRRLPQVLVNVAGVDRSRVDDDRIVAAVRQAAEALGGTGRVLLRPSGTEPLVRVMVEAPDEGLARATAEDLAALVARTLG
jgi:phosphoglucosamine mutase